MRAIPVTAAMVAAFCVAGMALAETSAPPDLAGRWVAQKRSLVLDISGCGAGWCGVEVKDQTGKVISTGKAATDPANKKALVVPVKELLPPGDYKVEWHAVSDDTHRVKGSYSFSVIR